MPDNTYSFAHAVSLEPESKDPIFPNGFPPLKFEDADTQWVVQDSKGRLWRIGTGGDAFLVTFNFPDDE